MDIKTITSREIKQITETFCEKEKIIMWHGKRIKINPLLSFKDTFELIDDISKCCAKEDSTFVPESVDFVFKVKMISKYANIDLQGDIEEQYKIIYSSDIFDVVIAEINKNQLDSIVRILEFYTGMKLA